MAFEDYDEHEQGERVQAWLRENVGAIIGGIVLGLILIFGINQWRKYQATHAAEAAAVYQQFTQAVTAKDTAAITSASQRLQDKYKDTAFAVFAAFGKAERDAADGKNAEALKSLQWAKAHAGDDALRTLSELRIATVQIALGKADDALATLAALPADSYKPMALELRGDALAKLKRDGDARKAYTDALAAYDKNAPQRGLLQLKLDNLAVSGHGA